jgi:hypothetical protein
LSFKPFEYGFVESKNESNMKKMKALFLGLAALTLQFSAHSQSTGEVAIDHNKTKQERKNLTPEEKVNKEVERRTKQLSLTASQQQLWRENSTTYHQKKELLHGRLNETTDKAQRKVIHQEMKDSKVAFDAQIMDMLTDEQKPKWEAIQQKQNARKEEKRQQKCEERCAKKQQGAGEQK